MSYQVGKMGAAEGIGLIFIITFCKVFFSTPTQYVDQGAGLSWLGPLVAGLAMLMTVLLLHYVYKWIPGDLYDIAVRLTGRKGAGLIALIYSGIFLSNAAMLMRQFTENTLLSALPKQEFGMVIIVYAVTAGVLVRFGIEAVARSAYLLMPFIISGVLIMPFLLSSVMNVYNLTPWQGFGITTVIKSGLLTAGINIGALAPIILAASFQNTRTLNICAVFGLGSSLLLKALYLAMYLMVFGVAFGSEKTLPFFETARLVYLGRFLQHIEAVFIITWVIVGITSIAISVYIGLYLLIRMLNLPTLRPLIPIVLLLTLELAMIPKGIVETVELDGRLVTMYYSVGAYVIPIMLFTIAAFRKFIKKDIDRQEEAQYG